MKKGITVIIITAFIITGMFLNNRSPIEATTINYETIQPKVKSIHDYINVSGKIKEGNKKSIRINGVAEIVEVYVQEGDMLSKNQVIAKIKPVSAQNIDWDSYYLGEQSVAAVFEEYGIEIATNTESEETMILNDVADNIKSPISGIVTKLNMKEGETISAINQPVTVSDFSDLYISVMIPEEYSSKIAVGQGVVISAEALGDDVYSGKVEKISPTAKYVPSIMGDGKTYIKANVALDNVGESLRPGLNVNAKIAVETKNDVLTLPYECILQDKDNREYVYCINGEKIQKRYIRIGHELESEAEIVHGVELESKVIVNPPKEIVEG